MFRDFAGALRLDGAHSGGCVRASPRIAVTPSNHAGRHRELGMAAAGQGWLGVVTSRRCSDARVLRCREGNPGYDHPMSTEELSFD